MRKLTFGLLTAAFCSLWVARASDMRTTLDPFDTTSLGVTGYFKPIVVRETLKIPSQPLPVKIAPSVRPSLLVKIASSAPSLSSSPQSQSEPLSQLENMPAELLAKITAFLPLKDQLTLGSTSRHLRQATPLRLPTWGFEKGLSNFLFHRIVLKGRAVWIPGDGHAQDTLLRATILLIKNPELSLTLVQGKKELIETQKLWGSVSFSQALDLPGCSLKNRLTFCSSEAFHEGLMDRYLGNFHEEPLSDKTTEAFCSLLMHPHLAEKIRLLSKHKKIDTPLSIIWAFSGMPSSKVRMFLLEHLNEQILDKCTHGYQTESIIENLAKISCADAEWGKRVLEKLTNLILNSCISGDDVEKVIKNFAKIPSNWLRILVLDRLTKRVLDKCKYSYQVASLIEAFVKISCGDVRDDVLRCLAEPNLAKCTNIQQLMDLIWIIEDINLEANSKVKKIDLLERKKGENDRFRSGRPYEERMKSSIEAFFKKEKWTQIAKLKCLVVNTLTPAIMAKYQDRSQMENILTVLLEFLPHGYFEELNRLDEIMNVLTPEIIDKCANGKQLADVIRAFNQGIEHQRIMDALTPEIMEKYANGEQLATFIRDFVHDIFMRV